MVNIGTLSWKVQVEKAAEAKKEAEEVGEQVENAKEAMQKTDEQTEGLTDNLDGLNDVQETVGEGFDKMNAKAGFLGTALRFVSKSVMVILGSLLSLKGLILGGLIVALAALAVAWKKNIGNIQGRVKGFVSFVVEGFKSLKETALAAWNNFVKGFKEGGGDVEDLKTILVGVFDGIEKGLKAFWDTFGPVLDMMGGGLVELAGVVGKQVGKIVDLLARMEESSGFITKVVAWVTALVATFATAWAIVQVLTAIAGAVIGFISVMGTVLGVIGSVISVIGTLISIFTTVVSVIGTVIAVLNPISLIILAIIGVIVALYVAWKTNFLGIQDIVANVSDTITSKIGEAVESIRGAISDMRSIFNSLVSNASEIGSNLIEGIKNGIMGSAGELTDAVSDTVGSARDYLPFSPAAVGPLSDLDQVGPGFINTITDGILNNTGEIESALTDVTGAAREYLPFSPAEKGPLKDIDQSGSGLVNTIASDIKGESSELMKAAEQAMKGVNEGISSENVETGNIARRGSDNRRNTEKSQEPKKIEINVGGIEIGDQTMDINKMSNRDLQRLAEAIAQQLGDEVRNVIS